MATEEGEEGKKSNLAKWTRSDLPLPFPPSCDPTFPSRAAARGGEKQGRDLLFTVRINFKTEKMLVLLDQQLYNKKNFLKKTILQEILKFLIFIPFPLGRDGKSRRDKGRVVDSPTLISPSSSSSAWLPPPVGPPQPNRPSASI